MKYKRIRYMRPTNLFTEMVKMCCDADRRATRSGAMFGSTIVSADTFVTVYAKRMARANRFGRRSKVTA